MAIGTGLMIVIVLVLVAIIATSAVMAASVNILNAYERGVVLTFGRYAKTLDPGVRLVVPVIQQVEMIDVREKVVDIKPQSIITKDNVLVTVNSVVYYQVVEPHKALLEVESYSEATRELGQASLRSVIADCNLDDLSQTKHVAGKIHHLLNKDVVDWGVKVRNVEIKEIDVDPTMMQQISRQATAERERRARIIEAEGEEIAASSYCKAAKQLSETPGAMQLRYLNTLEALGQNGRGTTIVFPASKDMADPPPQITAALAGSQAEAEAKLAKEDITLSLVDLAKDKKVAMS